MFVTGRMTLTADEYEVQIDALTPEGPMQIIDRGKFARSQWSKSGTGHPGTWAVPERDPADPTQFVEFMNRRQ